jgi:hypothetical protein
MQRHRRFVADIAARLDARVGSLRRPEYTGANRCLPCTALNAGLATLVSVGVGAVSLEAGAAVAALSGAAIYLRGYLVPGTPALTKQYLPARVLAWFDGGGHAVAVESEVDGEALLRETGVVVADDRRQDLVLEPAFETALRDRIAAFEDVDDATGVLARRLGLDAETIDLESRADAFVAWRGRQALGQWESRTAFLTDMAAAETLDARVAGWADRTLAQQSQTLGLLRLFLDRCPSCNGAVELGEDVVTSCCRSIDVVAATCSGCGDRLFEAPYDPDAVAAKTD